jgi:hypothetical protein
MEACRPADAGAPRFHQRQANGIGWQKIAVTRSQTRFMIFGDLRQHRENKGSP